MELKINNELVDIIQDAARKAITDLFHEHKEHFYYCSLITTEEALCPIISAWSREALERTTRDRGNVYPDILTWSVWSKETVEKARKEIDDQAEAKSNLKWSYAESPYFAYGKKYFKSVEKVFNERMNCIANEKEYDKEIQLRINTMEKAMSNLDREGIFGIGTQRLNIVINVELMPPDYTNTERALRLNPAEALEEWLEEAAEII